ncbi:MAG: DNA primase [Paracoccaceae bacterium]
MSLPSGFLDELRTRVPLAQVVGRKVGWDMRKSNPGKGDYWAPCPFHAEKTASFHVDDKKGFYYCFGCHAKGDALSFVRETENVGFMEAVEILAREAGMTMPAPDPQAAARDKVRAGLVDVMEAAVQFYRLQLNTGAATQARAYLERRGLNAAALERWEIGFAPDSRTILFEHLRGKGMAAELIVESGLAVPPDGGGTPFDRFRGRIMFPIRDARDRAIAFGGRAMDANAHAKYMNSPETPLFDKGRTLFNISPARAASGKSGSLVVAEGYMDVIALVSAGFGHAVAPLGTAVTEDQLRLMWRVADEPIIALDGDTAGLRAAMRLIDLALPMLEAGKSLRFALMPAGQDPDDLIRAGGAKAMQAALDAAMPLVDLLWQRETADQVFDSPERRSALDARLRALLAKINDPNLRGHYEAAIRERRQTLFRPSTPGGRVKPFRGPRGKFLPQKASAGARASLLARDMADETRVRESAILLGCLNHPQIAERYEAELERCQFMCPDLRDIATALLAGLHTDFGTYERSSGLRSYIEATLNADPLEKLQAVGQVRDNPYLRPEADPVLAAQAVLEDLNRQAATLGMAAEVREAEEELGGVADEGLTWRLAQAALARDKAQRAGIGDDSGAAQDDSDVRKQLYDFIDNARWKKKKH